MDLDDIPNDNPKCPHCHVSMYELPECFVTIFVCPECGCTLDLAKVHQYKKNMIDQHHTDNLCKKQFNIKILFNNNFMKKYTNYNNFMEFIQNSKLVPNHLKEVTYEVFEKIPRVKLDEYIKNSTVFQSWNEMFDKAVTRYIHW